VSTTPKRGTARRYYYECQRISDAKGPYLFGGGHAERLDAVHASTGLDCSSAIYLALKRAGFYDGEFAGNSTSLMTWASSGPGKWFTVWANPAHTFVTFDMQGAAPRFDTSPWGSGGRGPRIRHSRRPTAPFVPRHWPGR
jgi:hypothetical protein